MLIFTCIADVIASIVGARGIPNGDIYNVSAPVSKLVTLGIYIATLQTKTMRKYFILGMLPIIALSAWGYIRPGNPGDFHYDVYIISGFVISILSYLYMRQFILHRSNPFTTLFWFSFANLIYYTLMVSSMSASYAVMPFSQDFAKKLLLGNDIAYSLWSCLITFGIIWNKKKI